MAEFLTQNGASYLSKKGQNASTYSTKNISSSLSKVILDSHS